MQTPITRTLGAALAALMLSVTAVPATAGWDATAERNARAAIDRFKRADARLGPFFQQAYGYAVFPTVGAGGAGIGAAHGSGTVFERGRMVGTTSLSKVSLGLQLGGQTYRQIIFFKNKRALDDFKQGDFELAAGASAIALERGISTNVDYHNGIAIFTMGKRGLMFDASVGGQRFTYDGS